MNTVKILQRWLNDSQASHTQNSPANEDTKPDSRLLQHVGYAVVGKSFCIVLCGTASKSDKC